MNHVYSPLDHKLLSYWYRIYVKYIPRYTTWGNFIFRRKLLKIHVLFVSTTSLLCYTHSLSHTHTQSHTSTHKHTHTANYPLTNGHYLNWIKLCRERRPQLKRGGTRDKQTKIFLFRLLRRNASF